MPSNAQALYLTPGDVMAALGISTSTFQRISQEYEGVFPLLDRTPQGRRIWTLEAEQRLQAAHAAVKTGEAESHRAALEALRDGRPLPTRTEQPPDPNQALKALRLDVEAQGEGITQLLRGLDTRDAELAAALRALADAQVQQGRILGVLQAQLEAMARPVPTAGRKPQRGLLMRLLLAALNR
jgi:AraC-like DNA-binding protein